MFDKHLPHRVPIGAQVTHRLQLMLALIDLIRQLLLVVRVCRPRRRLQGGQLAEQRRVHRRHIGHAHIVAGSDARQQRCHVVEQQLDHGELRLAGRVAGVERRQRHVVGEAAEQIRRWRHDGHVRWSRAPVLLAVALVACGCGPAMRQREQLTKQC